MHIERGIRHESLDAAISRIAHAYGFSAPPVAMSKKSLQQKASDDPKTSATIALLKNAGKGALYSWGYARVGKRATVFSFAIGAAKSALAHALSVKAATALAERAGYERLTVLVSSVGDAESKRRFARELGTFFRKYASSIEHAIREVAAKDPEKAYRELVARNDPLLERAPKTIDYLSENSRKAMLDVLSFFEACGMEYQLEPRLSAIPGVQTELLFALEGYKGEEKVRIGAGGRFDELLRKEREPAEPVVAMSVEIAAEAEPRAVTDTPACFVVHIGDAAKFRAFAALESLWKADLLAGESLLSESLREQVEKARAARTKYIAIIGQREALDGTVIVRNAGTQLQTTIPLERLVALVGRK